MIQHCTYSLLKVTADSCARLAMGLTTHTFILSLYRMLEQRVACYEYTTYYYTTSRSLKPRSDIPGNILEIFSITCDKFLYGLETKGFASNL